MTVGIYECGRYKHTSENEAFHRLCSAAPDFLRGDGAIIGPVMFGGCDVDAIVFGHRSIIIIDFKNYGGSTKISEDKPWVTDEGVCVRGGGVDVNPFQQIRRYKLGLRTWLGAKQLLPSCNLGHIGGLAMFAQEMAIDDSAMGPKAKTWFRAAGERGAQDFLRDRASPGIYLSADQMAGVICALGGKPSPIKQSERYVPISRLENAHREIAEILRDQDDQRMIEQELQNRERQQEDYAEAIRESAERDQDDQRMIEQELQNRERQQEDYAEAIRESAERDQDDQRMIEEELQNRERLQKEYAEACRGWAISDALTHLRRALERRHPETTFPGEVVSAMGRAIEGSKPPLSIVLRKYQPSTTVDLVVALQNWGVEPDEFD